MLMKLTPGVNFINILQAAFTNADPKRAKKIDSLMAFFGLKILRKLTIGVNFINILLTAFALIGPKSVKNSNKSSVSFYTFGTCKDKSCM